MQLAAAQGRLQAQLAAQQKLLRLTDSLAYQAGQSKVQAMESLIEGKGDEFRQKLDVARLRNAESAARARYRGMLAVAIFLASAMLVGVLLMLQRRRMGRMRAMAERQRLRRAQAELRLQQEQLEKERIHRQLELKQKDITDLAMDISLKRRITNELVERLKRLKASPNPVRDIQEMIMTLRGQTEHEVQSRLTPENIDLVNHAFYEKLKATYPGLTSAEMDLCGMLRMRLGSKEIGALRNITAHSVRVSKYRLKKKLGLGKDEDLVEVLQRL
jgi:DNA-binding CsgD family transcriptional regulator